MLPAALELLLAPLLFAEEEVCTPGAPSPWVQILRSGPCQEVTGGDLVSSGLLLPVFTELSFFRSDNTVLSPVLSVEILRALKLKVVYCLFW